MGGRVRWGAAALLFAMAGLAAAGRAGAAQARALVSIERTERFDRDPGWDRHNNRSTVPPAREVRQDFGYRRTGPFGRRGAVGGFVTPAAEPAYYAKVIRPRTLADPLYASGTIVVGKGGTLDDGAGNTLVGFFNASTVNEWRTPNSIALRLNARGDGFHVHLEYATSRYRAGGVMYVEKTPSGGRARARMISGGVVHTWSLKYDPNGNNGGGAITATLDGEELVCPLDAAHRADGATFNRFGILNVMKSADQGGSLWLGDVTVNGVRERLARDPRWEGRGNRRTYMATNVRPRFDFGYSPTSYAGGSPGECGGLLFRGDQRYPERLAYYGDRLEPLTLDGPLRASGKVVFRRGVTDSTILFGFFHAPDSVRSGPEQTNGLPENFLGATIEAPSREGFCFYPSYGVDRESEGRSAGFDPVPPHLLPDGQPHTWKLDYNPNDGNAGRITLTLDNRSTTLDISPAHRKIGARFNRFGFVTTHIDGNGQHVYLDDLTYTFRQAPPGAPAPEAGRSDGPPPGADGGLEGPLPPVPLLIDPGATVRHVSAATGSDRRGNGTRRRPWATLARALAATEGTAARPGLILVAAGTYHVRELRLKPYVDLYGGFTLSTWERESAQDRSVLDGDKQHRLLIGADHARVDGFTLRGGRARGHGGGVLCDRTSPVLTNNVFVDNATLVSAEYLKGVFHQVGTEGGAIAILRYASPRIEHNLFVDNWTEIGGGAAIALRSDSVRPADEIPPPVIRNNVFIGSRTGLADTDPNVKKRFRTSNGGAISLSNYLAEITGNLFIDNRVGGNSDGGAIYCEYESSPLIAHNHFIGNRAEDDGAAIYTMKLSEPRIEANVFAGNVGGGSIRLSKQGRARIAGNLIFENPAGGINSGDSWGLIEGNVIMANGGAGYSSQIQTAHYMQPSVCRGNVIRGNARAQVSLEGGQSALVESNNVEGGWPEPGNRDVDPGRDAERHSGSVTRLTYDAAAGQTRLAVDTLPLPANRVFGRLIRVGDRWGVIRNIAGGEIAAWGDLGPSGTLFELPPTYLPVRSAP